VVELAVLSVELSVLLLVVESVVVLAVAWELALANELAVAWELA